MEKRRTQTKRGRKIIPGKPVFELEKLPSQLSNTEEGSSKKKGRSCDKANERN